MARPHLAARPLQGGAGRIACVPLLVLLAACEGTPASPAERAPGGAPAASAPASPATPAAPAASAASAASAARAAPAVPSAADGAGYAAAASDARVSAWATGVVEVFVNGVAVAKGARDGDAASVATSVRVGGENVVVLRATAGAAAAPALVAELHGVFGRAGTTPRWKVKAASGSEATEASGPWTEVGYDDGGWSAGTVVAATPAAGFPSGGSALGLWTSAREPTVLARLKLYVPEGLDTEQPRGFGRGVTGGAGGAVVRPTTLAELSSALCGSRSGSTCTDTTPRVVEISREFDFVGSEGKKTATGCYAYTLCSGGTASEILLDAQGGCAGKSTFDVTYDAAGVSPLLVGSNKTLLGVGAGARIRGKGLTLRGGVSNVIVRNVTITDLNPQVVWGGDALTLDDADRVWIDHNRISLVGRQMFVTGWGKASNVTLSWNELDGRTPYAAYCDGAHYWVSLNLGEADTITMLGNWVHHTSGRGPHAGGYAGVNVIMHLVNNAYEDVSGHALNPTSTDSTTQSRLLAEGNHFARVTQPVLIDAKTPGLLYAPASEDDGCRSALGRACAANVASPTPSSGWPPPRDDAALSGVAGAGSGAIAAAFPASEVPNVVPHLAGVGHIGAMPAAQGFSLSASPARLTLQRGGTAATAVAVTPSGGFTGAVALSATGLPAGVTASFEPASTATASTVTFRADANVAQGTATVTIRGASGATSATAELELTVARPPEAAADDDAPARSCGSAGGSGGIGALAGLVALARGGRRRARRGAEVG